MVSVDGEAGSNMLPTTACIAVLGVLQAGLALLARPYLNRLLARRGAWKVVVSANAVSVTVFTWHMTAWVPAMEALRLASVGLLSRPTATWWLERPLWLVAPGAALLLPIKIFARYALPGRSGRG